MLWYFFFLTKLCVLGILKCCSALQGEWNIYPQPPLDIIKETLMWDGCISVFLGTEQEKSEVGLMAFMTQEDEKCAMKQSLHSYKYYKYKIYLNFATWLSFYHFTEPTCSFCFCDLTFHLIWKVKVGFQRLYVDLHRNSLFCCSFIVCLLFCICCDPSSLIVILDLRYCRLSNHKS